MTYNNGRNIRNSLMTSFCLTVHFVTSNWILRFICLVILVKLTGCGVGNDRFPLMGKVTLDGQPVADGVIRFRPQPGTKGPTAGGKITDGQFSIESASGTFTGTFSVEISAYRKTGRKMKESELIGEVDEMMQIIPACYNTQSQLIAEVKANGPNRFEFALKSR